MSIFKREPDPPYNRAAASRAAPTAPPPASTRQTPAASPTPATDPAAGQATQDAKAATPAETLVARDAAAVVDRNTEITGTLHSSGNVLIEGHFHGEVEAKDTVWVEKGAQTDGQLRAAAAVISGAFDGQIDCGNRLQVAATVVVSGEIKTPILVIEDGATVNCRFSMARNGVPPARVPSGGKR